MEVDIHLKVLDKTKQIFDLWDMHHGIAPVSVSEKLNKAMIDWHIDLTRCLDIWVGKGEKLSVGELLLARANLGAVVENWLKFFYTVYYEDYSISPKKNNKDGNGEMIEPEKLRFEFLKQFSKDILFEDHKSDMYKWVEKVQHKRNAIHSFNYKDIGDTKEFIEDLYELDKFIDLIESMLPPLDDIISMYIQNNMS